MKNKEIKIKKNTPPLEPIIKRYPFSKMLVGDSFYVPLKAGGKLASAQIQVISCARNYRLRHNPDFKITTRIDENGVMVWRIK